MLKENVGYNPLVGISYYQLLEQSTIPEADLQEIVKNVYYYIDYIYDANDVKRFNEKGIPPDSFKPKYQVINFDKVSDVIDFITELGKKGYFMIESLNSVYGKIELSYTSIPFEIEIPGLKKHCINRIREFKINNLLN